MLDIISAIPDKAHYDGACGTITLRPPYKSPAPEDLVAERDALIIGLQQRCILPGLTQCEVSINPQESTVIIRLMTPFPETATTLMSLNTHQASTLASRGCPPDTMLLRRAQESMSIAAVDMVNSVVEELVAKQVVRDPCA
jgi:hypothetical protein